MADILILIGAHLCTAPRPQKEADALVSAGHRVTIFGVWFDKVLASRDRAIAKSKLWQYQPVLDFRPQHPLTRCQVRVKARLARELYRRHKKFSPYLLGYGAYSMLSAALAARADLTIVHSELGLWVGDQLLNRGFQVGVDFEDWFSEDLPLSARASRPIEELKSLEAKLINRCKYCLTTSKAMATSMAEAYAAPVPKTVYNSFPYAEREQIDGEIKDRKDTKLPSIHWFSQTIGPKRGLETLMSALPQLTCLAEIHLRGSCSESACQWLNSQIPQAWQPYVFIHPTVANSKLLSRIAEHDIGLALEMDEILSRDLTVTNKLFQYMQAGLAIVATDTTGQREVLSLLPDSEQIVPGGSSAAVANALNTLLSSSEKLRKAKHESVMLAEKLSWETCREDIIQAVKIALS